MAWRVEILEEAETALEALPEDIQASFSRIARLIEGHGLERMREPHVKHLEGRLWEMLLKGRDGIARAAYVTATGRRVVVVHVFVKETEKTPPGTQHAHPHRRPRVTHPSGPAERGAPMIRPARPEDAGAIRRLVQDAYGHYVARMGKPPGPMLDDYDRRVAAGQAWVLEEGGALAGILVLEDAGDGALLLDNVAVASSAQGKGFGRALVALAEEEAGRRGLSEVRLYTNVLMTENLALYRRLGFRETGRVNEKGYERVYMAKAAAGLT